MVTYHSDRVILPTRQSRDIYFALEQAEKEDKEIMRGIF